MICSVGCCLLPKVIFEKCIMIKLSVLYKQLAKLRDTDIFGVVIFVTAYETSSISEWEKIELSNDVGLPSIGAKFRRKRCCVQICVDGSHHLFGGFVRANITLCLI